MYEGKKVFGSNKRRFRTRGLTRQAQSRIRQIERIQIYHSRRTSPSANIVDSDGCFCLSCFAAGKPDGLPLLKSSDLLHAPLQYGLGFLLIWN